MEVELADGTVGHGAAAQTFGVTGESVASMLGALNDPIGRALTDPGGCRSLRENAEAIAASCVGNLSAKAAADVALHDAWARTLDLPLVEALGGDATTVLRTDMTISRDTPQAMAQAAVRPTARGSRC